MTDMPGPAWRSTPPSETELLGTQVDAVLTDGKGPDGPVIVRGVLIAFSAMGELVILGDDGDVHWCWPMLDIRPRSE